MCTNNRLLISSTSFFFLTITLFLPLLRGDLEAQVALLREEEANTEAERNKQRRVVNQS
jgi:hypothetical protein